MLAVGETVIEEVVSAVDHKTEPAALHVTGTSELQEAPLMVPLFPLDVWSAVVDPEPSLKL